GGRGRDRRLAAAGCLPQAGERNRIGQEILRREPALSPKGPRQTTRTPKCLAAPMNAGSQHRIKILFSTGHATFQNLVAAFNTNPESCREQIREDWICKRNRADIFSR